VIELSPLFKKKKKKKKKNISLIRKRRAISVVSGGPIPYFLASPGQTFLIDFRVWSEF
jgi:hypothetical protein